MAALVYKPAHDENGNKQSGIACPFCTNNAGKQRIVDSRHTRIGTVVRTRRCASCKKTFQTVERPIQEESRLLDRTAERVALYVLRKLGIDPEMLSKVAPRIDVDGHVIAPD